MKMSSYAECPVFSKSTMKTSYSKSGQREFKEPWNMMDQTCPQDGNWKLGSNGVEHDDRVM